MYIYMYIYICVYILYTHVYRIGKRRVEKEKKKK